MKFIFILLITLSSRAWALDLYRDFSLKGKPLKIEEINKIHMNKRCFQNSEICLSQIKQKISLLNKNEKDEKLLKGNPASDLCKKIKGYNVILYDMENNQHDYCEINTNLIDAWDMYYKLTK
jgi:hypothetical protein